MALTRPATEQIQHGVLTLEERLAVRRAVEEFGTVADGLTDDAPAISAALSQLATGRTLVFDGSKTYGLGSPIAIPAGIRLQTNGATFKDLNGTASNTPLVTIGDSVELDVLRVNVPLGKTRERVVVLTGDDFVCGSVIITAEEQQANTTDNNDGAFRMVGSDRAQIGRIVVSGFDRSLLISGTTDVTIGGVVLSSYTTGLWSVDNRNLTVGASRIHTASPNAAYTAGHVGVLLSCDGAGLSRNISLIDFNVEDSGEHGIRVGGPFSQENIHLVRTRIKNVGGSGIKILGTDSGAPTDFNNRIYITDPIIEDCASGGITTNMCGILVMYATDVVITNPIIRKQNKTVSASSAIRVVASADVEIVNPLCRDAQQHGIYLDGSLGALTRVNVQGGKCLANGVDGYRQAGFTNPLNDCNVDNLRCFSNGGLGFTIAGTGSTIGGRPSIGISVGSNTGGAGACDRNSYTLRIEGGEGATPKTGVFARNGSTWNDHVTLHLMKAAAWTAL